MTAARADEVQLRLTPKLTLEQYRTRHAWEKASLSSCPLHGAAGKCGFRRHGTYLRKFPEPVRIARFYCPKGHTTFSLLPDCLASRLPGTLDEVEQAATVVEQERSLETAAEKLRPAEAADAVVLESAKRWTARRVALFAVVLMAVVSALPDRLEGVRTAGQLRQRLGTESALMALREIAAPVLRSLPLPLGFGPRRPARPRHGHRLQQCSGPDPPGRRQ